MSKPVTKDHVTIFEKYVEREDGIYYCWRPVSAKGWYCRKTALKEQPFVSYKLISQTEFEEMYQDEAAHISKEKSE